MNKLLKKLIVACFLGIVACSCALVFAACSCSHKHVKAVVAKVPTAETAGEMEFYCLDCGFETFSWSLQPLIHYKTDYESYELVKAPTHTEKGYVKVEKFALDTMFKFEGELPALGHTFNDYICIDDEYHSATCECGVTDDKIPHEFIKTNEKKPSCTEEGYINYLCLFCDMPKRETFDLLDHSYSNGVCICGKKQPLKVTYIDGDTVTEIDCVYGDSFEDTVLENCASSVFKGWYSQDGQTKYDNSLTITSNLTVYAKWDTVHEIDSVEDFLHIWEEPAQSYRLTANLNLRGEIISEMPKFTGYLDGNGFTIKNFSVSATTLYDYQGLIRVNEGTISNLTIADYTFSINVANASGALYDGAVGGIVGLNKGRIENLTVKSSAFNNAIDISMPKGQRDDEYLHLGAIVGKNVGTIANLSTEFSYNLVSDLHNGAFGTAGDSCNNSVFFNIGRICGLNKGEIISVIDSGDVSVDLELGASQFRLYAYAYVGGAVGNNQGKFTKSSTNCKIIYSRDSSDSIITYEYTSIGGFAGLNYGEITECYSSSAINGSSHNSYYAGGFVAQNLTTGKISSCYTTTDIILSAQCSDYIGGFVGFNDALIQSSYAHGKVDSRVSATMGGFVGANGDGGTIKKSYTRVDVFAVAGYYGQFAATNTALISKCYILSSNEAVKGEAIQGNLAITTDISSILITELTTTAFFCDNMYWNEEGWHIAEGEEPILLWQVTED